MPTLNLKDPLALSISITSKTQSISKCWSPNSVVLSRLVLLIWWTILPLSNRETTNHNLPKEITPNSQSKVFRYYNFKKEKTRWPKKSTKVTRRSTWITTQIRHMMRPRKKPISTVTSWNNKCKKWNWEKNPRNSSRPKKTQGTCSSTMRTTGLANWTVVEPQTGKANKL